MGKSKLTICEHCGQELAKGARVCPNCGGKHKIPIYKRFWFVLLIIFIIIGFIGSMITPNETEPKEEVKIEYTAYDLNEMMQELDSNPLNADKKYTDQYIEVTGKLNNIDSDGSYISLVRTDEEYSFLDIQCFIQSDEQLDVVSQCSIGDTITVKGQITDVGEVLGYQMKVDEIKR